MAIGKVMVRTFEESEFEYKQKRYVTDIKKILGCNICMDIITL